MKRAINYISIILGLWITVSSCSDRIVDTSRDPINGTGMVPITLDISGLIKASTYDTDYDHITDVPGNAAEDAVGDIIVYIFDFSYNCEAVLVGTTSPVGPELVKVGTKHFLVVVNGNSVFTGTNELPLDPDDVYYQVLRKRLTDAASMLPASPFLMVGERHNVAVTDQVPITNPKVIEVDVERACAKITMSFTKSGLALGHTIILQKVTLFKGAEKVYLFSKPDDPSLIDYTLTSSSTAFQSSGLVPNFSSYINLLDTFYTYAADVGQDTAKAVRFEIEASINGNTRTAKFFLAEYETTSGDTVYDIRRNFWYDVNVNMIDPGMDSIYVTVIASRWNVAETQQVVEGEGYEIVGMASPLRLVKFINYDQMTAFPTSAAIVKHPKGAAWFDLKVSDGAFWGLEFKNEPENIGAKMSIDDGATWYDYLPLNPSIPWSGTDSVRVFVYRPYEEDAEPIKGPSLALSVGGKYTRDIIVQGRDVVPFPTNSFVLRPRLVGVPINDTRVYIPLNEVHSYWEDYLLPVGDTISRTNITAAVLWKDETGEVIRTAVVMDGDKRDGNIYIEAGAIQGNAVVELRAGGVPFWSYHLWVTEYNPYEPAGQKLNSSMKTVFMDRNLGAQSNVYDTQGNARGMYYQFGRKDPFPRGIGWSVGFQAYDAGGGALTMMPGIAPTAVVFPNPPAAIPASFHNPLTFYTNTAWPLYTEDNDLWETTGGNKTAYDPCPEGWRVPKQDAMAAIVSPWFNLTFQTLLPDYPNGRYSPIVGYYPYAGYLTNGSSIDDVGTQAYFWSAWKGTGNLSGTGLYLDSSSISMQPTINKYYGVSVRCVVDDTYLQKVANGGKFGKYAADLMNSIQ